MDHLWTSTDQDRIWVVVRLRCLAVLLDYMAILLVTSWTIAMDMVLVEGALETEDRTVAVHPIVVIEIGGIVGLEVDRVPTVVGEVVAIDTTVIGGGMTTMTIGKDTMMTDVVAPPGAIAARAGALLVNETKLCLRTVVGSLGVILLSFLTSQREEAGVPAEAAVLH